jgi:chromosome segregation ATPase
MTNTNNKIKNTMNFLIEKKHILEMKLEVTSIQLEKKECIRNQQHEKAADLRDQEKELLGKLNEKKNNLIELQNNLRNAQHSIEEFDHVTMLKLQEAPVKPKDDNPEIKTTSTNEAFDRINQIKNDILKGNN